MRQVVLSPMGIAVLDRIAALEAQLAAVQQANVMARDIADQAHQRAEKAERELAEAQARLAMAQRLVDSILRREPQLKAGHLTAAATIISRAREVQSATAEAVAQHTAEVERRGAAKELRRISETSIHTITLYPNASGPGKEYRLVPCEALEARAAELEGA